MGLKLQEIKSHAELAQLMPIFREAFTNPGTALWPIFTADLPGASPSDKASTLAEFTDRFWAWHEHGPSSHWLSVIDDSNGAIVGGGRWALYEKGKGNPYDGHGVIEAEWFPVEGGKRVMGTALLNQFLGTSVRLMNRPHAFLNILFTHPSHRRRGAASLLMNWGLEHADRLGLETFIEATDLGKPVYEKFGFRVMEHHSLHAPEKPEGVKVEEWRALEGKVLPFEWWSMVKDAKKIE